MMDFETGFINVRSSQILANNLLFPWIQQRVLVFSPTTVD